MQEYICMFIGTSMHTYITHTAHIFHACTYTHTFTDAHNHVCTILTINIIKKLFALDNTNNKTLISKDKK